jgi:hypothetical protein
MTVNMWAQALMGEAMPNYTKFDIVRFAAPGDVVAWPAPPARPSPQQQQPQP